MLSYLTFNQIREVFQNVIYTDSGVDIKIDDGFMIEGCEYLSTTQFEVDEVISGICYYLGVNVRDVNYWIEDDCDLEIDSDVKRIEITIEYGRRIWERVTISIVYNRNNDPKILDYVGQSTQKILVCY